LNRFPGKTRRKPLPVSNAGVFWPKSTLKCKFPGMKSKAFGLISAWIVVFPLAQIVAQAQAPTAADARIERGRYLVERVVMCADCHTARDWKGKQDREHWLQGAKLDFKPARRMPWAAVAPAIAGLTTFATDEQAVKYFETGINRAGKNSSPPMSQYRFDHDDAVAVVAYLRSLKPPEKTGGR
jgi:mono/diheme cytochrome c family protein